MAISDEILRKSRQMVLKTAEGGSPAVEMAARMPVL